MTGGPAIRHAEPVRIAFCWSIFSGYMAACWRALATLPGVQLSVVTFAPSTADNAAFDSELLAGLDVLALPPERREDYDAVRVWLMQRQPDALAIGGWGQRLNRRLLMDTAFPTTKKLLFMDNVFRGDMRQWMGRLMLQRYLRRVHAVFVSGERCATFARFLGIPAERIKRSTYGVDSAALEPLLDTRAALPSGWPRRFLFVGKYDHIKGVDILMRAYEAYRRMVVDPWDMVCCGAGPLVGLIAGQTGVVDKGFLQPHQVRAELLAAGAFVLASRRDQWPLAIAEACAAGLPIVCSDACGVASELLRDYWNGVRVPPGSVSGLAEALLWVHQEADRAPELGRRSQALAAPFAAGAWADRVLRAVRA